MRSRCSSSFLAIAFVAGCGWSGLALAEEDPEPLTPARYLELKLDADAAWEQEDLEAAVPLYEKLLAVNPRDGEIRRRLALALREQGRTDSAVPLARRALETGFANEARMSLRLARVSAMAGEPEKALRWIRRALDAGLENRPQLKQDEAFASLRDDPRFRELAGFAPSDIEGRVEGWRHDLEFFVEEARRYHPAPERTVWESTFVEDVRRLQARVSDLDDVAVAMELQKLVVRHLADGHSVVYPLPTDRVPMPGMLPIQLYFFSDGLFVVDAEEPHTDLVDQRVLAIGGRSTDGLLDDLKPIVSRDNEQGLRWIGSLYLRSPAALRAIGYANSLETVPFTFSDGQKQHTIALSPEPPQRRNEKLPPPPGLDQPPRWQARADENYWHEAVPEMGAVYVQFNQVRNASSGASIAEFAKKVRDTLRASGAKELILDVRHNNGGNNFLHWPILRVVAWHGLNGDDHRTFVLIGRNTFSACQNFVNFLERATDPIFVGEISSSKPNFAGEGNRVELPWSGLMLSISSRWWQDSYPSDERPYIPVDMPVEISSRDWLAGRDPVMEALRNFLCLRSHKTEGGGCDGRGAPL